MVESSLYKAFAKECERLGIAPGSKILLAVSGGIDSIVMATLFHCGGFKFSIVHVNFKLRGRDSTTDQRFVRKWAFEHKIQLFEKEVDTKKYAKSHGLSLEMAAREIRYNWFYELAESNKFKYIAVAHNADDNAETLLLNLVRGTGLKGLCGISENSNKIIRPLLFAQRSEIEAFAKKFKIAHREDKTNHENEFKRNKIRNQVLPLLKELNPSAIKTLNEDISHFKQAYAFEQENVEKALSEARKGSVPGLDFLGLRKKLLVDAINIEKICSLKKESATYALSSHLNNYGFSYDVAGEIVECAFDHLQKKSGKKSPTTKIFNSALDYVASVERGFIKIFKGEILSDAEDFKNAEYSILSEGEWVITFGKKECKEFDYKLVIKCNKKFEKLSGGLHLDADKLHYPLTLRAFRPGDYFSPFGLNGSKRVADFLGDKKVDTLIKPLVLVLCQTKKGGIAGTYEEIVCIPGVEIDNSVCITPQTTHFLSVNVITD